jgi:hypothetical protein
MKRSLTTGLIAAIIALGASGAVGAESRALPPLTLTDLNGKTHALPQEWTRGGVLILGFAHDARAQMDSWRDALKLSPDDHWIEAPIVGNVSGLIQPMIKAGMKSKYEGALRDHVTPVFEGADVIRKTVEPHADVVVLILDGSGQIVGREEGAPNAAAADRLRALR